MAKTSPVSRGDGAPASRSPGGEERTRSPVSAGGIVAGKYRIGAVVGFRGTGIACEGVHLDLGTKVALVFAHSEDARDERAIARFLTGARSAAQLRSQHARRVLDCGRLAGGEPYMVLESLEGADLRGIVTTHGSLPVEETLSLVLQACEALGEAHARGLVHGDLNPDNLFLTRGPDGGARIKVLGLEFATELGLRGSRGASEPADGAGSSHHLSPEQLSDATSIDARTDIWALGVLLYELLTGVVPFEGSSLAQLQANVTSAEPRSPREFDSAISKGLAEVVLRCLEKNPDTRFPDAATLGHALRAFGGSTASMSAARVEDVLRHARSMRPARDASPSVPAVAAKAASAPPTRSIHARQTVPAPKPSAVPRVSAASRPVAPEALAASGEVDPPSEESVRASWLMDQPATESGPASSEVESSEELVRASWLMDPPSQDSDPDASQPAPETSRSVPTASPTATTTPPPMPLAQPTATTTPPPMPVAQPTATTTPPPMPAAQPTATTTPPPMPAATPTARAGVSLPAATPSLSPGSTSGRTAPPPLPSSPVSRGSVIAAWLVKNPVTAWLENRQLPAWVAEKQLPEWVVKNQRSLLAVGGGLLVGLIVVLVSPAERSPAVESSASAAPARKSAAVPTRSVVAPNRSVVAPIQPVLPPSATPAVSPAPSATVQSEPMPPASAPSRPQPAIAGRTSAASAPPKRAARSGLYPVLKPPSL